MELVAPFLAVIYGAFAGIFLWSVVGRWILAMVTTIKDSRSNGNLPMQRQSAWPVFFVAFLHSGPWTAAIAGYLTYYLFSRPHASWWLWFYGGVCVAPILVVLLYVRALRKRKRLAVTPPKIGNAA